MPRRQLVLTIAKLILYYFAYQLGFSAVAMGISQFIVPMDAVTITSLAMVASTLTMTWHLIHFRYVSLTRDKYKEVSISTLGVSMVFIFSAMYVLNLLIEQIGIPNTTEEVFIAMSHNPLGILSIALLAPILEELLFRGAIQGCLQGTTKNPWVAILTASFIFGVVHMNPAQIPFAFLIGTMFGWLYYRTGSLLPSIIGHVLNNSVATVNMILCNNATIEEQIENHLTMWVWAVVATAACGYATIWLNRNQTKRGHISSDQTIQ